MGLTRINFYYCTLAVAILHSSLSAFEPEIKLAGRKDLVLGVESRQTVLELGNDFLSDQKEVDLSKIENLTHPFVFKDDIPVAVVATDNSGNTDTEVAPEPKTVNYDDATVLAVSASSFAKKVRGSLARGESNYLQLEGGVLLKPGTSFPVRLPQAQDQVFTLTITEITSDGYTLQIGEASKQMSFNSSSQSNSIQFSNP